MMRDSPVRRLDRSELDGREARSALDEAAELLLAGRLVAFPTETVYGLGADATSPLAVERIYRAKGRPSSNPLIVHAHDVASARRCVRDWPVAADVLAERFWPGPLTLVLPRAASIPDPVTAGLDTVGVRVPDERIALALLERVDRPLAAPSANRSTEISPTTATHVLKGLGGKVDLILDGGPTTVGLESTVVDLTGREPVVLRPGPIHPEAIAQALGGSRPVRSAPNGALDGPARAPGQMSVHYAPRTRTERVEFGAAWAAPSPSERVGVVAAGWEIDDLAGVAVLVRWMDPATAARELYGALHRMDDGDVERVIVLLPPDRPAWRAIRDRLMRATEPSTRGAG